MCVLKDKALVLIAEADEEEDGDERTTKLQTANYLVRNALRGKMDDLDKSMDETIVLLQSGGQYGRATNVQ